MTNMLADFSRRAHGALLGAAIGDAMGSPCEGATAAEIAARYGRMTDFVSDSVGTDDTDFTLFNATILLAHGVDVTPEAVEEEWRDKLLSGKWFYRPGGFSDVTSTRNLVKGLHTPASGSFGHQMWSDGVAMAISGAGIVSPGNPAQAAHLAQVLGSVSNGRDGIFTAQAVAAAISVAMLGASPIEMMDAAIAAPPPDSWTRRALERTRTMVASAGDPEAAHPILAAALTVDFWPWADLAPEAVALAFAAFLVNKGDFVAAVPYGIRFGRDADTIGAIVGSLAGAYCGEDAIPPDWKRRVEASTGACIGYVKGQPIVGIADRLAEMAASQYEAVAA